MLDAELHLCEQELSSCIAGNAEYVSKWFHGELGENEFPGIALEAF